MNSTWVGVGAGGVIHQHRRVGFAAKVGRRIGQADLTHGHTYVRARAGDVDLARIGEGLGGGAIGTRGGDGGIRQLAIHCYAPLRWDAQGTENLDNTSPCGLAFVVYLDSYAGASRFRFNGYHLSRFASSTPSRCPHSLEPCRRSLKPAIEGLGRNGFSDRKLADKIRENVSKSRYNSLFPIVDARPLDPAFRAF